LRLIIVVFSKSLFQLRAVIQNPRDPAECCRHEGILVTPLVRVEQSNYATNGRRDQPKRLHLTVTGNVKSIVPGA
jgi:hypothetical protein